MTVEAGGSSEATLTTRFSLRVRTNRTKCHAMTKPNFFRLLCPALRAILCPMGLALIVCAPTVAQQIPAAITTDPARDKDFPASIEAPYIITHGARVNAVFYLASGAGPHPVVLLLHGLPGHEH